MKRSLLCQVCLKWKKRLTEIQNLITHRMDVAFSIQNSAVTLNCIIVLTTSFLQQLVFWKALLPIKLGQHFLHLIRADIAHSEVWAIEGVGKGIFVRSFMQLLNNTYNKTQGTKRSLLIRIQEERVRSGHVSTPPWRGKWVQPCHWFDLLTD